MQFCCMTVFQPVTARSDMPIFTFINNFSVKIPRDHMVPRVLKNNNNNNNNNTNNMKQNTE